MLSSFPRHMSFSPRHAVARYRGRRDSRDLDKFISFYEFRVAMSYNLRNPFIVSLKMSNMILRNVLPTGLKCSNELIYFRFNNVKFFMASQNLKSLYWKFRTRFIKSRLSINLLMRLSSGTMNGASDPRFIIVRLRKTYEKNTSWCIERT